MRYEVRADLRFEQIEDEIVVLDASGGTVHSLDGEAAEALRLVLADESVPERLEDAVDGLRDAGIVEQPAGWSRRKALLAGGVGAATAATGFFSMALPAAALASSCDPVAPGAIPIDRENTSYTFNSSGTVQVGRTVTMVTVQAWGGGGMGANGTTMLFDGGGGGGGGGGYVETSLDVAGCAVLNVSVGGPGQPSSVVGGAVEVTAEAGSDATGGTGGMAGAGGSNGANYSGTSGGMGGAAGGGGGAGGAGGTIAVFGTDTPGAPGNPPGGGGGGGGGSMYIGTTDGADGAAGRVTISFAP